MGSHQRDRLAARRASEAVVVRLAVVLRVREDAVRIVAGRASRRKLVEVAGLADLEAGRRLEAAARR